jgi:hypothetical protein
MKTQDIKRGITSRHCRMSGDAPSVGRLSRLRQPDVMNGGERRSRRRGSREGVASAASRRSGFFWFILLGSGTAAVIASAVFVWLLPRLGTVPEPPAITSVRNESDIRVVSRFPSPSREDSLELVRRAVTNRDLASVSTLFRSGTASPSEVVGFLDSVACRDGEILRYDWLSSMDKDGLLIEGVLVVYQGVEKPVERLAFLTPDDAGTWKLDFDAYARRVEPAWPDLLEKGAEQALVRVMVAKDVYYNGPFGNDKEWACYGIASPDMDELLRGYCRIGSPQAAAMERLFKNGEKLSRATLEIRRVKDAGERQFEITRLLGSEWILPAAPAGGS